MVPKYYFVLLAIFIMAAVLLTVAVASGQEEMASSYEKPDRLRISVPDRVSKEDDLTVIVTAEYATNHDRSIGSSAFHYYLLDEEGHQIAPYPLMRGALPVLVPFGGRNPTYRPAIAFDPACETLETGNRYQLICVMPQHDVLDSVWFTLIE